MTLRAAKPIDFYAVALYLKRYQRDRGHTDAEYEKALVRLTQASPSFVWILEDDKQKMVGYVWTSPMDESTLFIQQMYAPNHGPECYRQLREKAKMLGFNTLLTVVIEDSQYRLFTNPTYGLAKVGTVLKVEV